MNHLTLDQRYKISIYSEQRFSLQQIADEIGSSKSTISRELRRNRIGNAYIPEQAQKAYQRRLENAHKNTVYTIEDWRTVEELIKQDFSPEQISGRRQSKKASSPSHERIYLHIWDDKSLSGQLYTHLRHQGKRYRKRGAAKDSRGIIPNRIGIENRPDIVEEKTRFGDLEIDTIIGKNHKGALLTINDRATNLCWIRRLKSKDSKELARMTVNVLRPYKDLLKTITSDNGKEFGCHEFIARELGIDFYFARPYHSCDRGANENMNGLIRQYVKKGTSFEYLTPQKVRRIEQKLNNRPRKRLGYSTPSEYFYDRFRKLTPVAFAT